VSPDAVTQKGSTDVTRLGNDGRTNRKPGPSVNVPELPEVLLDQFLFSG
jgi:hypothetical protein